MENKIIIDAEGEVFGRLCSHVAKLALEGNEVVILNSEKSIISGNRKDIVEKYLRLKNLGGTARKGPFYPKVSYMILKRGIRGMLPDHRKGIGKQAFLRIKCYEGIPKEFKDKKTIKIQTRKPHNYIELGELSKNI